LNKPEYGEIMYGLDAKKNHTYFVLFKHEILLKGNHIKRAKNMLMIWEGFGTTLF